MPPAFFINLLTEDPTLYVIVVVAVVISITLHELGHGIVAIWQGDDTPQVTGHMTLNPMVHMPPFSWMLLLLAGISYGLMPVNPSRFRSRYGNALVAAAGPGVNLILGLLSLTALAIWIRAADYDAADMFRGADGLRFLLEMGRLNFVLVFLNLLPIPPLDGSTVLADFSPGYRRLVRNPDNQGIFLAAFVLFFVFADRIWELTDTLCLKYLGLFLGA